MFVDRTVPRISREYECFAAAQLLKHELTAHVEACIEAGALPRTLPPHLAFRLLTVGLLGVAAMRVSDRIGEHEHPDALARDALDVAIAGLQASIPLRSSLLPGPPDRAADAQRT
jgi:AcrR family transcriptional regulator